MRPPLALLLLVAVAAGVPAATAAERVPTRTCPTRIEAPGPFSYVLGRDVVIGRLVFFGLGDGLMVPRARPGEDATTKVAIGVRTGAAVTLRVSPEGRSVVALDYIRAEWHREHRRVAAGSGQQVVRIRPCPPDTPQFSDDGTVGAWTAYNGGFLVAHRGCIRLRVTAPGEPARTRRVAVGVPSADCR